ncbi:MAG: N-acetylmuramoyl-L-alanine amidase [Cyanobacteria bacterium J06635_15]
MTKVTLEVGHGPYRTRNGNTGFEEGANGPGTTEHKEVTVMAKIAADILKQKGYQVKISDPVGTLQKIGQQAAGSDIFVSLHLNAFNKQAQGTEVLVHRNGTSEDVELAKVLLQCLVDALNLNNRGVKRQGLAVLSGVPASVRAACLTEAFFIDSVSDAATVRKMAEKAAKAIANGIDKYAKANDLKPAAMAS